MTLIQADNCCEKNHRTQMTIPDSGRCLWRKKNLEHPPLVQQDTQLLSWVPASTGFCPEKQVTQGLCLIILNSGEAVIIHPYQQVKKKTLSLHLYWTSFGYINWGEIRQCPNPGCSSSATLIMPGRPLIRTGRQPPGFWMLSTESWKHCNCSVIWWV